MKQATPEQIEAWKKDHIDVYKIEVKEDDKVCYLRKPTRKELSYASSVGTTDPMKFNELILKGCWLGGDEEILTNDSLFLAVSTQLDKVLEFKKAELEKL
jgi:hypothetical protein